MRYAAALDLPEVRLYAGTIKLAGVLGFGISVLAWAVGSYFLLRFAPSTSQPRAAVGTAKPPPLRKAEFTGDRVERAEQPAEKSFVYYTEEGADMRYATPAVAAAASLALAACATPSRDKATPTDSAATLNATAGNTVSANPAERLGKKLLTLIGGMKGRQDFTVERINEVLEVALGHERSGMPGWHETEISMPDEWDIWVRLVSSSQEHARIRFEWLSPYREGGHRAPLSNACLEFEAFATSLKALGYTQKAESYGKDAPPNGNWRFYHPKPGQKAAATIAFPEEGVGPVAIRISRLRDEFITPFGQPAGGRRCITQIDIEAEPTLKTTLNPAEALGQKLLALIGGLQSKREMTVERVNAALGVQMPEDPEWPGEYEIEIPLDERRYSWIRFESPSEHSGALLKFSITRPMHDRAEPLPLTPVCLEFEPFAAALERLGYTREGKRAGLIGEPGIQTGDWRFYRRRPANEYSEEQLSTADLFQLEGAGPVEISIESPQDEFAIKFGQSAGGRRCILSLEVEAKGSES